MDPFFQLYTQNTLAKSSQADSSIHSEHLFQVSFWFEMVFMSDLKSAAI